MSNDQGRIRAKLKDDVISVRVLINHPMETGSRKHPASGEIIPRHFIQEVVCEHNGQSVMTVDWGWGISANPYLSFDVRNGKVGDTVAVRWTDDQGQAGFLEATVA
ncbi:MAG: thiosulfate oxidation carrier complex protein SoxZ [Thiohalocapsa sp.]